MSEEVRVIGILKFEATGEADEDEEYAMLDELERLAEELMVRCKKKFPSIDLYIAVE